MSKSIANIFRDIRISLGIWEASVATMLTFLGILLFIRLVWWAVLRFLVDGDKVWENFLRRYIYRPLLLLCWVLGLLWLDSTFVTMPKKLDRQVDHVLYILLIGSIAYLLAQLIRGGRVLVLNKYDALSTNSAQARSVLTQSRIFARIMVGAVFIISLAIVLMSFEQVRRIGISLLASAGIAGVILGISAQKTLSMVFAGIQIAIAQPIRIKDVVIIEGQYGTIEEINLTNVVVTTWDQRNLMVPVNFFIEKTFENWTRSSSEIVGSVYVHVDYTMPLEPLRKVALDFIAAHALWDSRVAVVQVTDCNQSTMEVRVLISARSAGQAFDLRCDVREHLITYIGDNYPQCLPIRRVRPSALDAPETSQEENDNKA
ncbi:MAG: mechanosensitive ion channel domain-containing protein [Bacteroidota bacterium]